mgnify:CR=1 FL=1
MPVRTKLSPEKPNAFVDFGFPELLSTCLPTVQWGQALDSYKIVIVIIENLRIQNWKKGLWTFYGLGMTFMGF